MFEDTTSEARPAARNPDMAEFKALEIDISEPSDQVSVCLNDQRCHRLILVVSCNISSTVWITLALEEYARCV